jgi:thioredoxin-related protein
MKKIVSLLLMSFSLWANEAQDAAKSLGYIYSLDEGMAQAKKEHKLLMLVLVRDGCHWCKKFERQTLSDVGIKNQLNDFIKVITDKNENIPEKFRTNFSPTTYFVDPMSQKIVWELAGFKDPKDFSEDIAAAKLDSKTKKR